ncbi:hypothetical protein XPA_002489 [Xanthoria parietina]
MVLITQPLLSISPLSFFLLPPSTSLLFPSTNPPSPSPSQHIYELDGPSHPCNAKSIHICDTDGILISDIKSEFFDSLYHFFAFLPLLLVPTQHNSAAEDPNQ